MNKLEELGGLEAAKDWVYDLKRSPVPKYASKMRSLIEHIESLTADRDELKKRVEELATELQKERERLAAYSQAHLRQVSKLQAARKLAEIVASDARVHASIRAMARDFLKMLDSQAPESTPPEEPHAS